MESLFAKFCAICLFLLEKDWKVTGQHGHFRGGFAIRTADWGVRREMQIVWQYNTVRVGQLLQKMVCATENWDCIFSSSVALNSNSKSNR